MTSTPQQAAGSAPPDELDRRSLHDRVTGAVTAHLGAFPRFWTEPRPSAAQAVAYARRGEWTADADGPARRWHLAFTYLISIPCKAVAAWLDWCADRPGRFFAVLPVMALLVTVADMAPVLGWLIPDPLTLDYWPPLSWLPLGEE